MANANDEMQFAFAQPDLNSDTASEPESAGENANNNGPYCHACFLVEVEKEIVKLEWEHALMTEELAIQKAEIKAIQKRNKELQEACDLLSQELNQKISALEIGVAGNANLELMEFDKNYAINSFLNQADDLVDDVDTL
uniref:Uncharacterized protein n=1 Tax=Panagrolaimus sp. ES5 TaxID=591445 RepID=A0AC34FC33_9BILA